MKQNVPTRSEQQTLLASLAPAVQNNCDVSDARHGGDYSLCTYLMKMREYYRWEKGLPYAARLPREEVGDWLEAREQRWETLEEAVFEPLPMGSELFDAFDEDAVNRQLIPLGFVYSAGLGRNAKPHFFLGELEREETVDGYSVLVSGREFARDLTAPPAMSREGNVFVRRESLRRMLWEKLEVWRWSRPDNALGRAFACYDFDHQLEQSLDRMTDRELSAALMHEIGEVRAGLRLGDHWNLMVLALAHTPAELMARAVRDHLADCLTTLPWLAQADSAASMHFYLGNLSNMRKAIFPGLQQVYSRWLDSGNRGDLARIARKGETHWTDLAQRMLESWEHEGADPERLQNLVDDAHL